MKCCRSFPVPSSTLKKQNKENILYSLFIYNKTNILTIVIFNAFSLHFLPHKFPKKLQIYWLVNTCRLGLSDWFNWIYFWVVAEETSWAVCTWTWSLVPNFSLCRWTLCVIRLGPSSRSGWSLFCLFCAASPSKYVQI